LAKRFWRRFKKNGQSETRIAWWRPCLLIDRDKMINL
jgi:hypothetical protein